MAGVRRVEGWREAVSRGEDGWREGWREAGAGVRMEGGGVEGWREAGAGGRRWREEGRFRSLAN